jgi:hypothetical protein
MVSSDVLYPRKISSRYRACTEDPAQAVPVLAYGLVAANVLVAELNSTARFECLGLETDGGVDAQSWQGVEQPGVVKYPSVIGSPFCWDDGILYQGVTA